MHLCVPFSSGRVTGVAVWMDYHLDTTTTITSGLLSPPQAGHTLSWDPHTRQGVHLFPRPRAISQEGDAKWKLHYKFVFKPRTGDMHFDFSLVT